MTGGAGGTKEGRPSLGPRLEVRAELPVPSTGGTKKRGRPPLGPRLEVRAELPVALVEAVRSQAEQQGKTFTRWLGEVLSREVRVPYSYQYQEDLTTSASIVRSAAGGSLRRFLGDTT